MEKLLSTAEVAKRLDVSRPTVLKYCQEGVFPNAQQVGTSESQGFWVIPESDLEQAPRTKNRGLGRKATPRRRLTQPEYEALKLEVIDYWTARPPILRCPTCGREIL